MRTLTVRFASLVVIAALMIAPALAGAEPKPLELDEARSLLEEIGGPEKYPNANAVAAFDRTLVEFDDTGAYKEYGHSLLKILTDEGLDEHGDLSFIYHRRYGTVDIVTARVIKKDGTEIIVGDDLITEGTPPMLAGMNIYETDFRQKTIVFPNLEVGDAIETLIVQDYDALIENGHNGFYLMQSIYPIVESSVTIQGPSDMPLKHAVKGPGSVEFKEAPVVETPETGKGEDWTYYTWTARNVEQIEPEPGMVSPAQVATRVLTSTVHTWSEMSDYLFRLSDEKCVADDSVKELVAEITDGLTTTEEKIRAIHYWIIENVRYLGISMDRGAFLEPHYASYTLEKEYGVCRDKAVLMVTMLEEIGVPAWVVAINISRTTDAEVPNLFFEHGIVAIEDAAGGYRYIDPTQETSREVYATYPGDRSVLVLTDGGSDLRKAPHVPSEANAGRITDVSTLGSDGSIAGSVSVTGDGMYEEILRQIAKAAKEEQLRMMWEGIVQELYPSAELTDFDISDYENLYEPMVVSAAYEVEDYALSADPYVLFRIPAATGSFDILSGALFGRLTNLTERKYPLAVGFTMGIQEEAVTIIPDGYVLENFPDAVEFSDGNVSLAMNYEFVPAEENDGRAAVRYRRTIGIDSFQVSPEDYIALKEAIRLASRSTKGEVILKREEG